MEASLKTPGLIASTKDIYCCTIAESSVRERKHLDTTFSNHAARDEEQELEFNYFKSAQWSPDGTSLLTSSADNTIRTFIVPPTLLSSSDSITLTPYTTHTQPTPVNCLTSYPNFTLSDPSTTLYLAAPTALPIRLLNALSPHATPVSSYSLVSTTTEAYLTPASILFPSAINFFTGSDSLIALFDISRSGSGPVTRFPTIPSKRHKMKGGGVGMRGIISALAIQNEEAGMLAAGTWTRWLGLYDMGGLGGTVATWSVAEAGDKVAGIKGAGVSQVLWSPCGRYMFVVERMSKGALVFDVRVTGKLVTWLVGREAYTNQRLGADLFQAEGGLEIWAGGIDGVVKVWEGVGQSEGAIERSWEWKAHEDPVTSTAVHSSGTVVASCSGQRSFPALEEDDSECAESSEDESFASPSSSEALSRQLRTADPGKPDNSIRVWSL